MTAGRFSSPPGNAGGPPSPWERIDRWGPFVLLALMTLAFALTFSWLSLARHAAFQSHAFDLGNMDQAVWNTLHGRALRFTDMAVGRRVLTSRLAIHVEPLLALFAPLYLLHSGPQTLLLVQAVVVALGAVPAYLLARATLGHNWLALAFPAAFLLHPSLQNAVLDDFHAVTLSATLLLWTIYFAWRGWLLPYVAAGILASSTKEEVSLIVALCALFFVRRNLPTAAVALVVGMGWFLICLTLIIPSFNPAGHSPYLGRYAYLGHGLGGMMKGALQHPGRIGSVLFSTSRLYFLIDLLHPLGYVSLLAPACILIAAPEFAINMLSADPTMYSGFYQYSAPIIPVLVAAAALGTAGVAALARHRHIAGAHALAPVLCGLVLLASIVDFWEYGFSPPALGYLVPSAGAHQKLEQRMLAGIPPSVPVAAADEIEPHLSDRTWAYLLPTVHPANGPPASFIVLDASIPSQPVGPRTLHAVAQSALGSGYGVAAAQDGILLLRHGAATKRLPRAFFSFAFRSPSHQKREDTSWGSLSLRGVVVHPRIGLVNRSRPAVAVETVWRAAARPPPSARIVFYLSPVYSGAHPAFSGRWQRDVETPTTTWLPLHTWHVGRDIMVASLPLLPGGGTGRVDVAVAVESMGGGAAIPPALHVPGKGNALRLATISVQR